MEIVSTSPNVMLETLVHNILTVKRRELTSTKPPKAITAPSEARDTGEQPIQEWLRCMSDFEPSSDTHVTECLKRFDVLDNKEKEKARWVMGSDELSDWLRSKRSCTLSVIAETPPEDLMNAVTGSSAAVALILRQTTGPVLSFFCGLRTNDSLRERCSGSMGLLNSLNGQLLTFILDKQDNAGLAFLQEQNFMRKSRKKPKYALRLFKCLLGSISEQDVVFILLDSFSRLSSTNSDEIIADLAKIITEMSDHAIKLLVTDPLPNCPVKDMADFSLYVPDEITSLEDGLDVAYLEETQQDTIKKLKRRQLKASPR